MSAPVDPETFSSVLTPDVSPAASTTSSNDVVAEPVTTSRDRIALVVLSALAVFAFTIDASLHSVARSHAPLVAEAADLRLASLALAMICVAIVRPHAARFAVRPLDRVERRWTIGWLVGVAIAVHALGVGRVALPRWQDAVAFLITGLLVEELFFRALVQDAASTVIGDAPWLRVPRSVWVSAVLFALSHHAYSGFDFGVAAWAQVGWTLPLGILLGLLTHRQRSIVPAVLVHLANNAIVAAAAAC